jgi:hypothetical protein
MLLSLLAAAPVPLLLLEKITTMYFDASQPSQIYRSTHAYSTVRLWPVT